MKLKEPSPEQPLLLTYQPSPAPETRRIEEDREAIISRIHNTFEECIEAGVPDKVLAKLLKKNDCSNLARASEKALKACLEALLYIRKAAQQTALPI